MVFQNDLLPFKCIKHLLTYICLSCHQHRWCVHTLWHVARYARTPMYTQIKWPMTFGEIERASWDCTNTRNRNVKKLHLRKLSENKSFFLPKFDCILYASYHWGFFWICRISFAKVHTIGRQNVGISHQNSVLFEQREH